MDDETGALDDAGVGASSLLTISFFVIIDVFKLPELAPLLASFAAYFIGLTFNEAVDYYAASAYAAAAFLPCLPSVGLAEVDCLRAATYVCLTSSAF